jgi:hypothetical protein
VNVTVNRPGFAINPTSCAPTSVTGTVTGLEGASSPVSTPFQVGDCANLGFAPTVAVSTGAHASKANGAGLTFRVAYPKGALGSQAWLKEIKVVIPKQLPARLTTIQQACPAATFEANPNGFPVHSRIGEMVVHTEVPPEPLKGPVYFVSYGGAKFPDAVMVLSGDNVTIRLTGETLIKNGITSVTFPAVPGVPLLGQWPLGVRVLPSRGRRGERRRMPIFHLPEAARAAHRAYLGRLDGAALSTPSTGLRSNRRPTTSWATGSARSVGRVGNGPFLEARQRVKLTRGSSTG